jgi:hypothetical protein
MTEKTMTEKYNLEERILGFMMGIGIGTLIGFLLHDRNRREFPERVR